MHPAQQNKGRVLCVIIDGHVSAPKTLIMRRSFSAGHRTSISAVEMSYPYSLTLHVAVVKENVDATMLRNLTVHIYCNDATACSLPIGTS
jgi:hypothetical protein